MLAFYYNWFDENSWGPNNVPDVPLQPYVSRDRGVMGRQIDQAKAAGIDAFVVSWYGPRVENNQTETNLRALLDEAAARGFRMAVDFEVHRPVLRRRGRRAGARWRRCLRRTRSIRPICARNGKPVIFFWRQQRFNTGTWAAIRNAVDPGHGSVWIEEGVDVVAALGLRRASPLQRDVEPAADMARTASKFATRTRARRAKLGAPKVYVATVMPGYDDRKTGRGNAFAVGREDGAYYARSWQAAIGSAPDWIVITSFNEWPEGTYIEPSQAYGTKYPGPDRAVVGGLPGLGPTAAAARPRSRKPAARGPPRPQSRLCATKAPIARQSHDADSPTSRRPSRSLHRAGWSSGSYSALSGGAP